VPARILITFVAELKLYGFCPTGPPFAELNAYSGAVWREGVGRGTGATGIGSAWIWRPDQVELGDFFLGNRVS
jgi:hypothetical protein